MRWVESSPFLLTLIKKRAHIIHNLWGYIHEKSHIGEGVLIAVNKRGCC